jgi:hypothetical protein
VKRWWQSRETLQNKERRESRLGKRTLPEVTYLRSPIISRKKGGWYISKLIYEVQPSDLFEGILRSGSGKLIMEVN